MYYAGQHFESEPAADDHIWKYMDFSRFVSLLDSKSLFFGSAARMRDPWEGAFGPGSTVDPNYIQHLRDLRTREMMYMSCWSVGEFESAALWDLYQPDGKGVAIRSTWGRLTGAVDTHLYLVGGTVKYIDHSETDISPINIFKTYVYKRQQLEYEHEARLLYWTGSERENDPPLTEGDEAPIPEDTLFRPGVPVSVDLEVLVESVYVAPNAEAWVADLVRSVIAKYGHDFDVVESALYFEPK